MSAEKATVDPVRLTTWRAREARNANLATDVRLETELYSFLRTRILRSDRVPAFTLGQFWAMDSLCIGAGTPYIVVVYLVFDRVEDRNAGWGHLEASLSVDAVVHFAALSEGLSYITLFFSALSPLVGPMTYAEVQRAVEHYLGWCSNQTAEKPLWSRDLRFITVELVEQSTWSNWLEQRQSAIRACETKGLRLGLGISCEVPCASPPAEEAQTRAGRGRRQEVREIEL
ncbi:hypothetical protein VFPBJ_11771 [Purpureocillium lilacinum]|uniref:Uncharacterized protein n=1 Tax=Purpureocillium lilacinum TaxID=33203 RepID=A0A179EVM2_PURLI|nr:hypothetical protein VFPBJ_11771 [Purpureocillium lilacinum]